MSEDVGRVAYEARFAGLRFIAVPSRQNGWGGVLPWADLPPDAKAVWARVEVAVLSGAHRLQVVRGAWGDEVDLAEPPPVGATPRALLSRAEEAHEPARPVAPLTRASAAVQGFSGNTCTACGSFAMVRTGTCETCQGCGSTSGGCS